MRRDRTRPDVSRIVVVGAGVAGLVAARALAGDGDHVVVIDAGDRPGGALRSATLAGVSVDVGAEAFAVTRPETRTLVDELGLSDLVTTPRRADAHLLLDDGLHDMPHAMLGVPTDLSSPQLIAILGADGAAQAAMLDSAPVEPVPDGVTLGALVRARMGDTVAERILTPVVAGVHAADPDLVEASAVIPGLARAMVETGSLASAAARLRSTSGTPGSAIGGLRGGMTTLVRALEEDARRQGVEVRYSCRARQITVDGPGWRVEIVGDDGTAQHLAADAVVLAVDAPTAASLVTDQPDLADALSGITVGDVAVVAAVLDEPVLDADPVGSGVLVAPGHPRVRAKALTHATAKWEWIREAYGAGRHLVRLSYGRDGRIDEPMAELPDIVRSDLAAILGIDEPTLVDVRVVRWDRSLVFPRIGHRAAVERIRAAVSAVPGLAVVGAGLGGNGLAGTIALGRTAATQLTSPTSTPMGD